MKNDYIRVKNIRTKDKIFEIFCKATGSLPDYQANNAKRNAI